MCSRKTAALENPRRHLTFTPEALTAIRHDRYHHPHPRVQQKMEALWLEGQGCTREDSARLAAVPRRSAQRYLDEFAAAGLQRPRRLPRKGKANELVARQASPEDYFVKHPPPDRGGRLAAADHVGVGQRPLPAVRVGPVVGAVVGHRTAVLAQLFPEAEPDRAALGVPEEGVFGQPPPGRP